VEVSAIALQIVDFGTKSHTIDLAEAWQNAILVLRYLSGRASPLVEADERPAYGMRRYDSRRAIAPRQKV